MTIEVPRDREGTFEPKIVEKHQTRFEGFDDKIVSMYARGMTVRDIQGHLQQMYGVEVSRGLMSDITHRVMDEDRRALRDHSKLSKIGEQPMRQTMLFWVRDHIALIALGLFLAILGVAWLIFAAMRSHRGSDEVLRLRQRLYQLERETGYNRTFDPGPMVLPHRWIAAGSSATTSDGGCFLMVHAASPLQRKVVVTVRIDGLPASTNQTLVVGQRTEFTGKSGAYTLEIQAAEKDRARAGVFLRNRHMEAFSEAKR